MRRIIPTVVLTGAALLVSAHPVMALEVTVSITRLIQIQNPDTGAAGGLFGPNISGNGDYYAKVGIGGGPIHSTRDFVRESTDIILPFDWVFSGDVGTAGTVPITIDVWDADNIEGNDDHVDISPVDNSLGLVLALDTSTCEWTSSSDAGASGTPIRTSTGDGDREHFQALDLDQGGEKVTIQFDIACSGSQDYDRDGIPDGVERFGALDKAGNTTLLSDGTVTTDPCRPNIVIEIDFMKDSSHSHKPQTSALNSVRTAFDNASTLKHVVPPRSDCPYPKFSTGKTDGIGLILLVDDELDERSPIDFDELRGFRKDNFEDALALYVHYNLWVHNYIDDDGHSVSSGVCCDGKDFVVSLGNEHGDTDLQAGTFMHELGHSLGLMHWGEDGIDLNAAGMPIVANGDDELDNGRNCKPNYLSVMNYQFQTGMINSGSGTREFDYSRVALPALREDMLSETSGIGDGSLTTAWCDLSGNMQSGVGSGSLDYDGSTSIDAGNVNVDVAAQGPSGQCCNLDGSVVGSPSETLRGFDDWGHVNFQAGKSNLPVSGMLGRDELSIEDAAAMHEFWEGELRCSPPESGLWTISSNCTIWKDVNAPGDLVIRNEAVVEIADGATLDVDFQNHALRVSEGARMRIRPGGKLQ